MRSRKLLVFLPLSFWSTEQQCVRLPKSKKQLFCSSFCSRNPRYRSPLYSYYCFFPSSSEYYLAGGRNPQEIESACYLVRSSSWQRYKLSVVVLKPGLGDRLWSTWSTNSRQQWRNQLFLYEFRVIPAWTQSCGPHSTQDICVDSWEPRKSRQWLGSIWLQGGRFSKANIRFVFEGWCALLCWVL